MRLSLNDSCGECMTIPFSDLFFAPQTAWVFQVGVFLLGLCLGSFLNVCIWRMPRGETVVTTPSHCPKCNAGLAWFENIPLLSWLCLRGKCRHCGCPVTARYFAVEFLTGILIWLAWQKVVTFYLIVPEQFPLEAALICACIVTVFVDWKHRIIPDGITYPLLAFGLLFSGLFPEIQRAVFDNQDHLTWIESAGRSAFAASAVGVGLWVFRCLGHLGLKREVLGWGDIKFCAAVAACIGLTGTVFVLFSGAVLGTLFGAYLAGIRRFRGRKTRLTAALPFGPFLALGVLLWLAAGDIILIALSGKMNQIFEWIAQVGGLKS